MGLGLYHPAFGHDISLSAVEVSDDPDTQVAQVVSMMRGYTNEDADSPELHADARAIATGSPVDDTFRHIKSRLRFVPDDQTAAPFSSWPKSGPIVETLVRPLDMRIMQDPQGDCDDFAMSTAALLKAAGVPCAFCTVAVDPDDPSRFSHVYVVAYCDNGVCGPYYDGRISLDTSHGAYPGWEAPNPYGKREEWPLDGPSRWVYVAGVGLVLAGLFVFARWAQ